MSKIKVRFIKLPDEILYEDAIDISLLSGEFNDLEWCTIYRPCYHVKYTTRLFGTESTHDKDLENYE